MLFLAVSGCESGPTPQETYDRQTRQSPVIRHSQINSVLNGLTAVPFDKIDPAYLQTAGITGEWKRKLAAKTWYVLTGDESYRFVVGTFRIQDFLTPDDAFYAQQANPEAGQQLYLCLDRRILHKLLDLLDGMRAQGLDTRQIVIKHGFRHPAYNKAIGGASKSRHQFGEAIDLFVGDVNGDGQADEGDKAPLLKMLDQKIIGNAGGVGRYPDSHVIHMDVRGFRARWDQQ
ncbi:MAG TPA: D-Ala-D-Ala carboxypeptidase family metallohydrolase [Bacteroidia bacterium]|nr:D-Ala-D-Ala carboxypeptidase family metallohydrolase [Bacteroidia bacterium]